jgi:hypothetical protein
MTGLPEARYRMWRPARLADFEIALDLADPLTGPERRAELESEQAQRRLDGALARQQAVQAAAEARARAIAALGLGGGR